MDMFKKSVITWKLNGRRVPAGTAGAEKVVTETEKWYAKLGGKHVALAADKDVARKMLKKLAGDSALRSVGLVDPYEQHRDKPLSEHLSDYRATLASKGGTEKHVVETINRIEAVIQGCEFYLLADIEHGKVSEWLTELRKPKAILELPKVAKFKPNEAAAVLAITVSGINKLVKRHGLAATGTGKARRLPRTTLEAIAERMAQGSSPETVNHYIRSIRAFCRWLVRSHRMQRNPLEGLALLNSQVDIRHARRDLTTDELRRLLDGTAQSNRTFRGLNGEDRAALYLIAAATGFRARALAHLTAADFDLRAKTPIVILAARFNKSKKPKVQPLPPEAAAALARYLHHKPLSKPVWGSSWLDRGADMIRLDLEEAGIPYIVDGPHGPEYADFHGLRHTYLTMLGRAGVDLRTAQELAGHSTPVLTARYSHRRLDDLAGAVSRMPMLTGEAQAALEPARGKNRGSKTSTDDDMPENKGRSHKRVLISNPPVDGSNPFGRTQAGECTQMTEHDNTPVIAGVLSFSGCQGRVGVHCQQMTGDASKVLPVGEAKGKHGGSFSPDLARLIETWPLLSKATKQAIVAIVDAAKPRRQAG